jgi:hypothetical protein
MGTQVRAVWSDDREGDLARSEELVSTILSNGELQQRVVVRQ